MGDLVLHISQLVQTGVICQSCGEAIDGEVTGAPRACGTCSTLAQPDSTPDRALPTEITS